MTIATLKHNMIRKLGLKSSLLLSVSKLFSYPKDNLCRRYVRNETAHSWLAVRPESSPLRVTRLLERIGQSYPPAPFYDNPSSKRDVRGTNIPHTGAILQVWAREQRLRKGLEEKWRRVWNAGKLMTTGVLPQTVCYGEAGRDFANVGLVNPAHFISSPSSAAANKAYRRRIRGYER